MSGQPVHGHQQIGPPGKFNRNVGFGIQLTEIKKGVDELVF